MGMWTSSDVDLAIRMTITTVPDDAMVKPESMASEVVITKEMEKEEKQLMEEGERQENEMIEKVCCLFI